MNVKAVFPGKYIQGEGVLNELPYYVDLFGNRGLLLGSSTVISSIMPTFGSKVFSKKISLEKFRGECCEEEIQRVVDIVSSGNYDVMIGMGGGKVIDTAKIVADRASIPVIIIPTIASTDAPCSGCAVIYSEKGEFMNVEYQKMNPAIVLVDMGIISNSPVRFLVAGMGDALSTWFEAKSCDGTRSVNECGGLSTRAGIHLAGLCYETLIKYGEKAKNDIALKIVTPELEYITEANILLSGIGFESSGLAAAHSIHNGLTILPETHSFFHGEKVAFGVLAGLHLTNASAEIMEQVYVFCEKVGLPTTLEDLGLKDVSNDYLMKAAVKVCESGSPIYHEPVNVNPQIILESMINADKTGRLRKCI